VTRRRLAGQAGAAPASAAGQVPRWKDRLGAVRPGSPRDAQPPPGLESLADGRPRYAVTPGDGSAVTRPSHERARRGPLAGQTALITGGSSGIGAATARVFAAHGASVALAGRDIAALRRVASQTGAVYIPGDLCEPGCPRRTVEAAADALGGLDVLVSNAGAGWSGPFASMSESEIDSLLDLNLRAGAHLARAALRYLQPGTGRLVFIGSIAGLVGVPGETWYSATKAGLGRMADTLRTELRPAGIGVTLIIPGAVNTPYFARRNAPYARRHPRLISAQTVADAVAYAVEHRREEVIVPGWLSLPARLKVSFPHFYRLLESRFA
jgi:NAD(P)-dependent dehydrogenase (short-subunit alcohol dehydrogenase family)